MKYINSLYANVARNYTKDNFIKLTDSNFNEIKEIFNKTVKPGITETYEQMKNRLHDVGLDIENMYFSKGYYQPFTYKIGLYYLPSDFINQDSLIRYESKVDEIKRATECVNNFVNQKNFEHLVMFIDSKYHVLLFEDIYDMIPNEKKYNIFKFIYVNSDYCLREINHEIIRHVFKLNLDKSSIDLKVDKEGYVKIYRGVENSSSSLERAYSWSWDKKVAEFFSNRFKTGTGLLYKAKVKKENIVDYINERKEKEILVLPEHVEDIKIIKKYTKSE